MGGLPAAVLIIPLRVIVVPTGFTVNEIADPVTAPFTLPTPEHGMSVNITLPVIALPFCKRDPDWV
jgi:hypothetical protein